MANFDNSVFQNNEGIVPKIRKILQTRGKNLPVSIPKVYCKRCDSQFPSLLKMLFPAVSIIVRYLLYIKIIQPS